MLFSFLSKIARKTHLIMNMKTYKKKEKIMNDKNKEIEVEVVETEVEVKEEGKIKKFFKQNGKKILLTGAAAIGVGLAYTIGKSNGGTNEF